MTFGLSMCKRKSMSWQRLVQRTMNIKKNTDRQERKEVNTATNIQICVAVTVDIWLTVL